MAEKASSTPINLPLAKLSSLLKEIVPDWLIFGIQLHISLDVLRAIEANSKSRSIDDKFSMMLDRWLKGSKEQRTWSTVATALEAIGNRRLANTIRKNYGEGYVDTDLNTLQSILGECLADWCNFGLMLGVSKRELDIIDDRDPLSKYLIQTLEYWIDNSDDRSWEVLIEAVRNTGNEKLARNLENEYINK